MVFYRKYRPQKIAELDSEKVRERLLAIFSKEPPHAFLFTGPKGLGKTSTARIIAKVVNCIGKQAKTVEPCGTCVQCVAITNGTDMDVIEIDAASNRGIDEIRDLKDKIRLSPLKAKRKVYIIDEVHMLTTEAFNALLKTLEEPPAHAMFVLCTTEPHKVPPTILSRSFHIAFEQATEEELVRSFRRIATGEKLTIDDEALSAVAAVADGGFRDGAKILEELVMLAKSEPITKELVEKRYKIGSVSQGVTEMMGFLAARKTAEAIQLITKLTSQGVDVKFFFQALIDALHQELLALVGVGTSKKKLFSLPELRQLLQLLTRAHADVKYAVLSQIPLELAIIAWGAEANEVGVRPAKDDEVMTVETTTTTVRSANEVNIKALRKTVGNLQKVKAMYGEQALPIKDKPSDSINTSKISLMHYSSSSDTKEWVDNLWQNIISEMKTHNHTLAGVLRGCMVKSYDRKSLIIETLYTFHKDRLSEERTKAVLEEIIKQLTGNPVRVSIELKSN